MSFRKLARDFKSFAIQGNVMDLAVGVMIGGAFSKIVTSLVSDIFTPLLGLITGGVDFSGMFIALDGNRYSSAQAAAEKGVGTLNYGQFLTSVIDFFLIALCIFAVVRLMNKLMPKKEKPKEHTRQCPYCKGELHIEASRCPNCTSYLEEVKNEEVKQPVSEQTHK